MVAPSSDEIERAVRERYGRLAEVEGPPEDPGDCCGDEGCCDCGSSLYAVDTGDLPAEITVSSLGCGDPITLAQLQAGQVVLDLGSGAGLDCFLAAQRVLPGGQVIGVDMTPEMITRADQNREKVGLQNVSFRLGKIEALPVGSDSVDVVISNCVINLSPDKEAVFREAFRVLRPGGRLAVSDVMTQGRFGPQARADMDSWSACVSGAEDVADYAAAMRAAGFVDISIRDRAAPQVELAETVSLEANVRLFSARVSARKPRS